MVDRRASLSFGRRFSPLEAVGTFALVAGLLYFGAGIIVPLVLSILLAFALTPLVTWLNRRLRLPDAVAVIVAVIAALCLLAGLIVLTGLQLARLAQELPGYQETVVAKLNALQQQFGGAFLERINGTISALTEQVSSATGGSEVPAEGRPVPVAISNDAGPFGLLTSVLGSIIGPVATVAIVAVFLIFLLMGRADMLDRFIRLVGSGDYAKTNMAMADASRRVGRYLLVQLAINCAYGFLFGLGLWLIGVPSAVLWGLLIVVFRYIPFIGALIIATVPFVLAFAVDPGWNMLLMSLALFLVLDLTTANVIEPRLYGSSTGVSPIAILLSAMFWATLWGPIGLILATPMTVCLVVIGRHIPELRFLDTLLGSEPVLTPPERLYQRLLKGDAQMAVEMLDDYPDAPGQQRFIGEVAFPALMMASNELADRPAALEQRRQMSQAFEMLLEEFETAAAPAGSVVLLVGGRSEIDEAAAKLLALQLAERGVPSRVLPPLAIRPEAIERLELDDVSVVALVFLGSDVRSQARYVSRRLRRRAPQLRLVACALGEPVEGETAERLHIDAVHRSYADAARELDEGWRMIEGLRAKPVKRPWLEVGDAQMRAAMETVATEFGVPLALANFVDDDRHAADGDGYALTELVVEGGKPLLVTPKEREDVYLSNAYLQANGIHLYAGVPLATSDGSIVGALALLDYKEHAPDSIDLAALQQRADDLMEQLAREMAPVAA